MDILSSNMAIVLTYPWARYAILDDIRKHLKNNKTKTLYHMVGLVLSPDIDHLLTNALCDIFLFETKEEYEDQRSKNFNLSRGEPFQKIINVLDISDLLKEIQDEPERNIS